MRQRHVLHDVETAPEKSALRSVAAIDIFPKPKEDYQREQTSAGGIVSAFTIAVISILLLWELIGYVVGWNAYDTDLSVDSNMNRSMDFNIDISFPSVSCNFLSVDVHDSTGTRSINVSQSLQKIPLTRFGQQAFVGYTTALEDLSLIAEESEEGEKQSQTCRQCFLGVDLPLISGKTNSEGVKFEDMCCQTCNEVKGAYAQAGLPTPQDNVVSQCIYEIAKVNPGCQVVGTLHLKKVAGMLAFAPRRAGNSYFLMDVMRFNPSHTINKIIIGNPSVKRFSKAGSISQLDGQTFKAVTYSEVKYYLKIIPTTYNTKRKQAQSLRTYEYSVQSAVRNIRLGFDGLVPTVLFGFDFSPIQIDNYFVRPPFAQFVIRLCGIIGGLFVVLGVVDSAVAHLTRLRK